jgi:hypothetical protein
MRPRRGDVSKQDMERRKLSDELKKLGYQLRPRMIEPRERPGQIAFDDRGNAIYSWNDDRLSEDSEAGERARRQALDHPGLSMVDDEPQTNAPIRNNTKGLRLGYNPYESGLLAKRPVAKRRDLRELSKWVEIKKKMEDVKE